MSEQWNGFIRPLRVDHSALLALFWRAGNAFFIFYKRG
ncbi:hypothetical protein EFW58_00025 [Bacillus velezensis]|nr:hypothetical protein EFW58_00025 [Bacillus velezensis]